MKDKKYILSLDVSTSSIGISLFEDLGEEGKLILLTHFEPKTKVDTQLERLKDKADLCVDKIKEDFKDYNIVKVVVEKPLLNSKNQKTAQVLAMFNEYLTNQIGKTLGLEIDFISVHQARVNALPELLGSNGKYMSDFPKEISGFKKSKWSKFLIMYLISQRFPKITWLLNRNLMVNKKNFDRADSIVAGLGFMIKQGTWKKMGDINYWEGVDLGYDRCVEIIEKNIAYEILSKELNKRKNNKEITNENVKKLKRNYLDKDFKIKDYLNVKI